MKKMMKNGTIAILAAMVLAGTGLTAFAAGASSESVSQADSASEATTQPADEGELKKESRQGTEESAVGIMPIAGTINDSPNTGVAVAPMAVALLGLGMVPVILAARKK